MRDNLENTKSTHENSIYKKIGLGIYILFALIYYFFMRDIFLDGTFFLVAGITLLLIIIFNFFKKHKYDLGVIAFCIYTLIFGSVDFFQLNKSISAVAAIVLLIITIFLHYKPVNKG